MFAIFGFYKFKKLSSLETNKKKLQLFMFKNNVRGTVIIAKEGINGTIAGKKKNLDVVRKEILKIFKVKDFDSKSNSISKFQPFHRAKVKIKAEVVPIGLNINEKIKKNNQYVDPNEWNKLILKKDIFLIDARKPFEYKVGTFKGAVNPKVNHFRDFPEYLNKIKKNQPVAMFCTGGIRCEKASIYLKKNGFKNIFQLKGGILNYLQKIKKDKSLWKGECYVFDNRITVKHQVKQGTFLMCAGCRTPISPLDKKSKKYEEGVSCSNCHDKQTKTQKDSFRMRQKQITLAKEQGKKHIFQKEFK